MQLRRLGPVCLTGPPEEAKMPEETKITDTTTGAIPDHGVPAPACDEEPKGTPTSDRHLSETAPAEKGGDAGAPKHRHTA